MAKSNPPSLRLHLERLERRELLSAMHLTFSSRLNKAQDNIVELAHHVSATAVRVEISAVEHGRFSEASAVHALALTGALGTPAPLHSLESTSSLAARGPRQDAAPLGEPPAASTTGLVRAAGAATAPHSLESGHSLTARGQGEDDAARSETPAGNTTGLAAAIGSQRAAHKTESVSGIVVGEHTSSSDGSESPTPRRHAMINPPLETSSTVPVGHEGGADSGKPASSADQGQSLVAGDTVDSASAAGPSHSGTEAGRSNSQEAAVPVHINPETAASAAVAAAIGSPEGAVPAAGFSAARAATAKPSHNLVPSKAEPSQAGESDETLVPAAAEDSSEDGSAILSDAHASSPEKWEAHREPVSAANSAGDGSLGSAKMLHSQPRVEDVIVHMPRTMDLELGYLESQEQEPAWAAGADFSAWETDSPETFGLLTGLGPLNGDSLDQTLQNFLSKVDELGDALARSGLRLGLPSWLVLLAGAVALYEVTHRRGQRSPSLAFAGSCGRTTETWLPNLSGLSVSDEA